MASINKNDALNAAAHGIPYVGFGVAQHPGDGLNPCGFGSAYDFPQDTQQHFEGYAKELSGDDALGPDMDGDNPGDSMGTRGPSI
jgi:hypothetical protein